MNPRGQRSGGNAGLGLEVQGYVLLLMSSPPGPLWLPALDPPASPQRTVTTSARTGPGLPEQCEHHSVPLR
ncbi:hypothetical protein CesoFtcFv8_004079 [Champsocephalus esox]|uniref:Uncharacterized protein n=1 Tax=Champsocephalus esox TaxID=159716 RepID=A0AAN8CW59_9TELE|nr:hypothetical protein CesoFtcFv8_004079 [Champsocephalus esox]